VELPGELLVSAVMNVVAVKEVAGGQCDHRAGGAVEQEVIPARDQ
jgi:hypothetical protein